MDINNLITYLLDLFSSPPAVATCCCCQCCVRSKNVSAPCAGESANESAGHGEGGGAVLNFKFPTNECKVVRETHDQSQVLVVCQAMGIDYFISV